MLFQLRSRASLLVLSVAFALSSRAPSKFVNLPKDAVTDVAITGEALARYVATSENPDGWHQI